MRRRSPNASGRPLTKILRLQNDQRRAAENHQAADGNRPGNLQVAEDDPRQQAGKQRVRNFDDGGGGRVLQGDGVINQVLADQQREGLEHQK